MKFQLPALLVSLVCLAALPQAEAQVTLSLTSQVTSGTSTGYSNSQEVTLTMVLDDAAFTNTNTSFANNSYTWTDAEGNGDQLFSSVSLTDATGTYQVNGDTHTEIYVFQNSSSSTFYIYLGDQDIMESLGLSAPNSQAISTIDFEVNFSKFLSMPSSTSGFSPSAYFQNYDGTYTATGQTQDTIALASGSAAILNAQSLEISGTAVPEPDAYALILGALALVGACLGRRRTWTSCA